MELKHTIKLIQELTSEIDEIENEIKLIMDEINSPILSIPGINYRMGAMIIAEIGDFNRFDSPDKILAYLWLFTLYISNLVNLMVLTRTWKSEVPDIYDMRYTMQPNMSAIGIQRLLNTAKKRAKASIIMSLYLMPSKS